MLKASIAYIRAKRNGTIATPTKAEMQVHSRTWMLHPPSSTSASLLSQARQHPILQRSVAGIRRAPARARHARHHEHRARARPTPPSRSALVPPPPLSASPPSLAHTCPHTLTPSGQASAPPHGSRTHTHTPGYTAVAHCLHPGSSVVRGTRGTGKKPRCPESPLRAIRRPLPVCTEGGGGLSVGVLPPRRSPPAAAKIEW